MCIPEDDSDEYDDDDYDDDKKQFLVRPKIHDIRLPCENALGGVAFERRENTQNEDAPSSIRLGGIFIKPYDRSTVH